MHTVLAFLTVGVFVAYIIIIKDVGISGIDFGPGAAMFLLPIFSLAACILYKRDSSYSGAFPVKQPLAENTYVPQQPVNRAVYVPQQPVNRAAYVPQQTAAPEAPAEWICVSCNAKNDPSVAFCPYCGAPNPAPAIKEEAPTAAPSFCSRCGAKLEPGSAFCSGCGAKLN